MKWTDKANLKRTYKVTYTLNRYWTGWVADYGFVQGSVLRHKTAFVVVSSASALMLLTGITAFHLWGLRESGPIIGAAVVWILVSYQMYRRASRRNRLSRNG